MKGKVVFLAVGLATLVLLFVLSYHNNARLTTIGSVYTKICNFTWKLEPYIKSSMELKQIDNDSDAVWIRNFYATQSANRVSSLNRIKGSTTSFDILYNAVVPEVSCPIPVRVGTVLDGGKYICNPRVMPKGNCSIYSLGLANEVSFDVEIQKLNNFSCRIYGYDKDTQSASTIERYREINGELQVARIAPTTNISKGEYFLGDLLAANNDTSIEILKMDIEGAEHTSLIPFLQKFRVCQIALEVHGKPYMHISLLQLIAELNYALFSYEINGYSLDACEYSFIHLDCMKRYGATIWELYLKYVNLKSRNSN